MRILRWLPPLALGLALALSASAPALAADKPDAARIDKLIAQLGADDFDDREKASAELAAVGEPALDPLRQALKSSDEEVRKRAETLVAAIEKRAESAAALAPKRVRLVYKDTPVKDAVYDFKKQSGYDLTLHDPDNKLKDRTVTLDTGDATFWQALDRFCDKAGLKEADAQDLAPKPPAAPPGANPPAVAPAPPLGAPTVGPGIGIGPALPPGVVVAPGARIAATDAITLLDGKPEGLPTDATSAVRVQALSKADRFAPHPEGEYQIVLRLSLEPKLQLQGVDKATISKAVDDRKQEWTQTSTGAAPDAPPAAPVGGPVFAPGLIAAPLPLPVGAAGLGDERQDILVHLRKGDKAAKSLAELTGTVTATLLGGAKPVITATEILKAKDKVFKGGDGGQIKVIDAAKTDGGQITIRLEFQPPADVVPVGGDGPAGPFLGPRRIRRVPIPAPPGAVPGAVGVAVVIGPGGAIGGVNGLGLVDDKGNPIKQISVGTQLQVVNGVTSMWYVLTYQAEKGQEASQLVYSGRKVMHVDIPFALKDVPLP